MVHIPVAVALLDHNSIVAIPVVTIPDHVAIAIAIPIAMAGSDGNADRADADANFFRASRHGDANSGCCNGYDCKMLDHCLLSSFVNYRRSNSCWLELFLHEK
jgi:hypothetical protein